MTRKLRLSPIGIPQHIVQRGNNRQACFLSEKDFISYTAWLKQYAVQYQVDIHAWVFMTNHVHLLATPQSPNAISSMMQSLGRKYVRYFNDTYQRTGTLWEGRFKSCLVQSERYCLQVYRYIELNPVRAGIVDDPAKYYWSSYQVNALARPSDLCTPHQTYQDIATGAESRIRAYRSLFSCQVERKLIENIRDATNRGLVIGDSIFKQDIESLTGRKIYPKIGRPKKCC